ASFSARSDPGDDRREHAPRSSVLKFDIAIFFDRYLLERLHRSLQQTDLLGIGCFAVLHVRSLRAGDAFLLLADLAARQVLEGRGRDVGGIDEVGIGCARADDCRDCKSNVNAKAHSPPQYGGFEATFCTVQLAVQVGASAALPCELRWRRQQARAADAAWICRRFTVASKARRSRARRA